MAAPYCPPYKATFEKGAADAGWDLVFYDGKFDAAVQAGQMDEAIAMKPDLIILCALDAAGMAPGIKKAFEAGIPVIVDHSKADDSVKQDTVGFTGPDNYTEGLIGGEMMNKELKGKGNVVIITGAAGQEAAINRPKGFKDKLVELKSEIKVLAEQTAEWDKAKATKVMEDYITRFGKEINGVYGADDTLAAGAWVALEEAGYKKGDVVIIGMGGSKEGLAAVKDGTIYGTVLQSPVDAANAAIKVIKMALEQGIKPPKQMDPYFNFMPLPQITAANVDQYLPGDW
jgi:ribose transport system substrate-binding protein